MNSRILVLVASFGAASTGACVAQSFYPTAPDWTSTDTQVSTGGALVDLNRDGWLDFVVANGNDILQQRLVVYYGSGTINGTGTLERTPSWQSSDVGYHGHLDVADVDGDGFDDVAVAVLLAQGGPAAKLYRNVGGVLSALPVWTSSLQGDAFGVSFGDMNADGRPDLALGAGQPYSQFGQAAYLNPVYLNQNGLLAATPSWQTATPRIFMNCLWLDGDDDGWLDLWQAESDNDATIYRNLAGTLDGSPTWRTLDSRRQFTLMAAWGDVNNDGQRDLLIADNNQLFAGSGRFRRYLGLQSPSFFETSASWTYFDGYASALALGDVDADGDLDVVSGEWFGRTRVFAQSAGTLPATPTWTNTTSPTTTVEKLCLGDIDRSAVQTHTLNVSGSRKLVLLPHQPFHEIMRVEIDGVPLTRTQYTFSREQAWLSVGVTPVQNITVRYKASSSLDLAVTNWDSNRPNQVYFNRTRVCDSIDFNADGLFPDDNDLVDFLSVLAGGDCSTCNDIDFDNDGLFPSDDDLVAFLRVLAGGTC
jgi:hypothetical protein